MKNNLTAATIAALVAAKSPYRLQVAGNALAPSIKHGDLVTVSPAVNVHPRNLSAGCALLVAVASNPKTPEFLDYPTLCTLNADSSITVGTTAVPPENFVVLGTVRRPEAPPRPAIVLREEVPSQRPTLPHGWACIS